ncbi:MAG: phosphatidylcholine/phosphatidylserine synthase [Proteobacteria bacterium]|nr:phosphatidylcholine/phosphatidylserine synthase [Pseudomonadota bacterium]
MLLGRRRRRLHRLRGLSVNALVPNAVTVLGMCAGLTAIRFAFAQRWELAVGLIILAGIIDGLDGRIARVLKASSEFGAQLDSLSDFLCFGVAPAVVLYLWTLHVGGGAGWAVALLFAVCMALRLARFNAGRSDPDRPVWKSRFFTGLPAPVGGGVIVLPMMLSFEFGDAFFREPIVVALHVIGVSALTVSTIPMYSGKGLRVRQAYFLPVLLFVGLLFAAIVGYPWHTFSLLGIGYLASIPFSIRGHRALRARAEAEADEPVSGDDTELRV